MGFMRSHQNVHMIWHDHERIERVTIAIEVAQRVGNRCRNLRPPKDAFAMALIEPRLTRIVKSLLILVLRRSIPRFRMKFPPRFQFFFPLPKQFLWDGIGQTEGNEKRCALLFPMREAASGLAYWRAWVHGSEP